MLGARRGPSCCYAKRRGSEGTCYGEGEFPEVICLGCCEFRVRETFASAVTEDKPSCLLDYYYTRYVARLTYIFSHSLSLFHFIAIMIPLPNSTRVSPA